jgi:membrane peptidoglycan carboxypeptidase
MALKSKGKRAKAPKRSALLYAGLSLAAIAIGLGIYVAVLRAKVRRFASENPVTTAYLERRTPGAKLKSWVALSDISPFLICSVLKAEDRAFFRHGAFDWRQVARTLLSNLKTGRAWGASTLTQQLARNLFLSPDPSLWRKMKEAFWAHAVEAELEKKRILEIYLNVAEWGEDVWGVREAALRRFGRAPSLLDPGESIFLASLLAAPKSPLALANLARAAQVQNRVLAQLRVSAILDGSQAERANVFLEATRAAKKVDEGATSQGLAEAIDPAPYLASECGLDRELGEKN